MCHAPRASESTCPMSEPADPVTQREVPIIAHLYHEVASEEAQRRGEDVGPDDPQVRAQVCEMVLRIGAELREAMTRAPG